MQRRAPQHRGGAALQVAKCARVARGGVAGTVDAAAVEVAGEQELGAGPQRCRAARAACAAR
jgi:hypothetical protein